MELKDSLKTRHIKKQGKEQNSWRRLSEQAAATDLAIKAVRAQSDCLCYKLGTDATLTAVKGVSPNPYQKRPALSTSFWSELQNLSSHCTPPE